MSITSRTAAPPPATSRLAPRGWFAAVIVACLFLSAAVPLILSGHSHERSAFDQNRFHVKVIGRFAEKWPRFDFRDYLSATTPGYHVALATARRFGVESTTGLRLLSAGFTVGLLATLAMYLARRLGTGKALALLFPLAASLYVFFPGVWLLPDNAGWWALAALLLNLLPGFDTRSGASSDEQHWSLSRAVLSASLFVFVIITRQVHAWAVLPIAFAAWHAWPARLDRPTGLALLPPHGEFAPACARLVLSGFIALPGLLLLAIFLDQWSGLVPPAFQPTGSPLTTADATNVGGTSPATPAFILALIGLFGLFFLPIVWPARSRDWLIPTLTGAAVALALATIPRTNWELMSRISGLWNLVRALPCPFDRSPLIITLATLGGAWIGLWSSALPARSRWVLGSALLGFTLAHTMGALSWQRYFEPFVLMMLVIASAQVWTNRTCAGQSLRRANLAGPITLGVLQATLTVYELFWRVRE